MSTVDKRLLEIVGAMLERELTEAEAHELRESHKFIVYREWRYAAILNKMWIARRTKDWAWFEQLMPEYDKVMKLY
ncbi:DUF7667 family protein [Paenibacillus oceani]|uniref:Uncharacterized protein n=1 Tax=Paenibacillus oceani TaxID=2772510 RepID=A0A927GYX2_9BACL|nr:hypothetical protein [Paenibacillus oceani]MBD2861633.1 hypothetical protein [Paenibacillus oceani]